MYNLHPPLTAFPFALLTCVLILEGLLCLARFFKYKNELIFARHFLLILAACFGICSYLSGYWARSLAGEGTPIVEQAVDFHHSIGTALLFVLIPCPLIAWLYERAKFGKNYFKLVYLVFLIASFGLTVYTGYLGGRLVFTHAVGVANL